MTLEDFKKIIVKGHELIGLDIGTKTIGVALSDISFMIASPVKTIFRTSFANDMALLDKLLADCSPCGIVSGLPLQPDGQEGEQAKYTKMTGDRIAEHLKLPIFYKDERFSSKVMERMMIKEADLSRKKRKEALDRSAAAYILQGLLDELSFNNR